jgi:O-antigen/teichoic acid export membrane protein
MQVLHTFTSRLLAMALGVAAGILVTRFLGAEGRGHYAVIISIATIATSLGHLSVEQSQAQLYAQEPRTRASLAANSVYLGIGWGAVVAGITFVIVKGIGPSVFPIYTTAGLVLGVLYIPLATGTLWTQQSLLLRGRMTAFNIGPVLSAFVMVSGVGLLQMTGNLTATSVIAVWGLSVAVTLAVSAGSLRARPRDVDLRLGARTARLGLRYHPGMASFLLLMRVDVLILNAMASARLVGLYTLAVSVAELINLLTNSVANVLLGRQFGGTDGEATRATALSARINLLAGGALGLGLVVVAPTLVPLVYGKDFEGSVPALVALVPGVVALAWARGVGAYFVRRNKPMLVSLLALGAVMVNVALNVMLIPTLGIIGASFASSIAYAGYAIGSFIAFRKLTSTRFCEVVPTPADLRQAGALARHTLRLPRREQT